MGKLKINILYPETHPESPQVAVPFGMQGTHGCLAALWASQLACTVAAEGQAWGLPSTVLACCRYSGNICARSKHTAWKTVRPDSAASSAWTGEDGSSMGAWREPSTPPWGTPAWVPLRWGSVILLR